MFFLAIFSFYTGLRLWHLKPKAVATAKTFLTTQLILIVIITLVKPFLPSSLGAQSKDFSLLFLSLLPSFLQFGVWYLYLAKSVRVANTYRIP